MTKELVSYFTYTFVSLFTVVNPLSAMPFYSTLIEGADRAQAKYLALRASGAALAAMIFFALSGKVIFSFFNVSVDGLRVVGGVLFSIIGYDMLQGRDARTKSISAVEKFSLHDVATKAITPLAIPLICGPGTITVVTVMMQESSEIWQRVTLLVSAVLVGIATYIILMSSKRITNFLGESGQRVFYRLMGLILMMIAVEYFFAGIRPYIRSIYQ